MTDILDKNFSKQNLMDLNLGVKRYDDYFNVSWVICYTEIEMK